MQLATVQRYFSSQNEKKAQEELSKELLKNYFIKT